jgi:proline iminopeptidase
MYSGNHFKLINAVAQLILVECCNAELNLMLCEHNKYLITYFHTLYIIYFNDPIMSKFFFCVALALSFQSIQSQSLYSVSFGEKKNPAIIFLHGGPGYNCSNFEATTAANLAQKGFYVIVYDRRGEGRSADIKAKFTFDESFNDLQDLYKKYGIEKATLMGHSFGGIVATLFAEKYPEKINSIVLVGAPIALQETFKTIIQTCKTIYTNKNDDVGLSYLEQLEQMDTESIEYSSACFYHAMKNGFYTPKVFTEDAKKNYALFKTDTTLIKYASSMSIEAPKGFWKNEAYTSINLTEKIKQLLVNKVGIYGMYGKDDGLYSAEQMNALTQIVGLNNIMYLDNCSHNVFIDQQIIFLNTITKWLHN